MSARPSQDPSALSALNGRGLAHWLTAGQVVGRGPSLVEAFLSSALRYWTPALQSKIDVSLCDLDAYQLASEATTILQRLNKRVLVLGRRARVLGF
jgi:hypothetical protein